LKKFIIDIMGFLNIMVKEEDMKANLKIMMQLVMISDMIIIIKYYIKGNLMLINIIDME